MHTLSLSEREHKASAHPDNIKCPHCGIGRSSRGKPFNQWSLSLHIRMSHASEIDAEVKPDNALACEICGCWRSRKGTPFFTEADLSRHRSVAHL